MISKLADRTVLQGFVIGTLLLPGLFSVQEVRAAEVELGKGVFIEVKSLRKKDLPRGFPFQVFNEGFAILGVVVRNNSSANFDIDPEVMEARNHKKKRIKRARSSDITPKIIKYGRAGQMGTNGRIYSEGRATPGQDPRYGGPDPRYGGQTPRYGGDPRRTGRVVDVGGGSQPGVVVVGEAQKLTALLEGYEIQPGTLPAGESVEGFFYLKSKKSGRKLSGQLLLSDKDGASVPF